MYTSHTWLKCNQSNLSDMYCFYVATVSCCVIYHGLLPFHSRGKKKKTIASVSWTEDAVKHQHQFCVKMPLDHECEIACVLSDSCACVCTHACMRVHVWWGRGADAHFP